MSRIKNAITQDKMFINNAIVKVPRSTFYMNQKHSTTFNAGKLVPLAPIEVLPGDTMTIDLKSVIRTSSPFIKAPMDDLHFDAWAFFVPNRIIYEPFTKMIANYQEDPDWTKDTNITVPDLTLKSNDPEPKVADYIDSILDHMGVPCAVGGNLDKLKISQLPVRAYCKVWNEWFRDENLQRTIYIPKSEYTSHNIGKATEDIYTSSIYGGQLLPLNKMKDYFTSALPAPQAGAAATISVGGNAPIVGTLVDPGTNVVLNAAAAGGRADISKTGGIDFLSNQIGSSTGSGNLLYYAQEASQTISGTRVHFGWADSNNYIKNINGDIKFTSAPNLGIPTRELPIDTIFADLSKASGISVNDLRYLVQIQQIKEADARYGRRYKEYLLGHFGVVSADARLDIPEFLGHTGYDLNINQTVQTSGTEVDLSNDVVKTPQSNISSYSLTSGNGYICNKSFTEHGYIIIVCGVRIKKHTYSQGINRMWFRESRFDFYVPELANIGEQPVYNGEIYATFDTDPKAVFGYQEAWASYRYTPNITTGYMSPSVPETLAYWNFADKYTSQPTLSDQWIREDYTGFERCLAISSQVLPHFTADFFVENKAIRPMPVHSIPGLLDHSGKIII